MSETIWMAFKLAGFAVGYFLLFFTAGLVATGALIFLAKLLATFYQ